MDFMVEFLAKGFYTMLIISMPCVLVAAAIGLVVGILQAVTQVQEQTIAAAPKIIGVFLTIVILGMFYIKTLTEYFQEGMNLAFNVIPKSEEYILPHDYYVHSRPFANEMKDANLKGEDEVKYLLKNPGKIPWSEQQSKSKYTPAGKSSSPTPNFIEINKMIGR